MPNPSFLQDNFLHEMVETINSKNRTGVTLSLIILCCLLPHDSYTSGTTNPFGGRRSIVTRQRALLVSPNKKMCSGSDTMYTHNKNLLFIFFYLVIEQIMTPTILYFPPFPFSILSRPRLTSPPSSRSRS